MCKPLRVIFTGPYTETHIYIIILMLDAWRLLVPVYPRIKTEQGVYLFLLPERSFMYVTVSC